MGFIFKWPNLRAVVVPRMYKYWWSRHGSVFSYGTELTWPIQVCFNFFMCCLNFIILWFNASCVEVVSIQGEMVLFSCINNISGRRYIQSIIIHRAPCCSTLSAVECLVMLIKMFISAIEKESIIIRPYNY